MTLSSVASYAITDDGTSNGTIVLEVNLPGVVSAADIKAEVVARKTVELCATAADGSSLQLEVPLPHAVGGEFTGCKFSRKRERLTLKLVVEVDVQSREIDKIQLLDKIKPSAESPVSLSSDSVTQAEHEKERDEALEASEREHDEALEASRGEQIAASEGEETADSAQSETVGSTTEGAAQHRTPTNGTSPNGQPEECEGEEQEELTLHRGDKVCVVGLKGRPELNGKAGRVVGWVASKSRYRVLLNDGTDLALKVTSLTLLPKDTEAKDTQESLMAQAEALLQREQAKLTQLEEEDGSNGEASQALQTRRQELESMQHELQTSQSHETVRSALEKVLERHDDAASCQAIINGLGHDKVAAALKVCTATIRTEKAQVEQMMQRYGAGEATPALAAEIEGKLDRLDRLKRALSRLEVGPEQQKQPACAPPPLAAQDGAAQARPRKPRTGGLDYSRFDSVVEDEADLRDEKHASDSREKLADGVRRSGGVPERMDYIQELLARTENPAESSPERLSKEDPQTAEEQEQLRERMSAMVDQVAAASSSAIGDEQKMLSVLYGVYGKDKTTMSPEDVVSLIRGLWKG